MTSADRADSLYIATKHSNILLAPSPSPIFRVTGTLFIFLNQFCNRNGCFQHTCT